MIVTLSEITSAVRTRVVKVVKVWARFLTGPRQTHVLNSDSSGFRDKGFETREQDRDAWRKEFGQEWKSGLCF